MRVFFFFEIMTMKECVESVLYVVSLGCQFCQLLGPGLLIFGWSVILSTLYSFPFC